MALVGAESVEAGAVVANVGIALAFVNVDTRITAGCQSVAAAADALERALEVVTFAVVANTGPIATLVNISAISAGDAEFVAIWTSAFEASWSVDTLGVSTARTG